MLMNVFTNLKDTTVSESMIIDKWLYDIKMGTFSDRIGYFRGLSDKEDIKKFKEKQLPCIIYNVLLDKKRNTENIVSETGYFFFDIDGQFDTRLLNRSKIFALYKSCSGNGIHIIVKVNGLTKDNYDNAFDFISDNLGISEYVDRAAKKIIQPSLISYDPDLFHNANSLVFDLSKLIQAAPKVQLLNNNTKKETFIWTLGAGERIHFNCAHQMDFGKDAYIADWQNINFIECWLPNKIKEGKRNSTLFAYGVNLVYLNPTFAKEKYISILNSANITRCEKPLEYKEIVSIINTLCKYNEEGKLEPLYRPKKRSIVFRPEAKLDYDTKMAIVHKERAKKYANDSKEKIRSILETWDFEAYGLISQRNIAKNFNINIKTVEKYYSEFKQDIQEMNMAEKLTK